MTEYWKSQAKKFCEYCKVWITDNKASVGFHEGGKKHQMAVQNRLKEIRRRGIEDSRNSREEASMILKMEEEALNDYRCKDLGSNSDLTASIFNTRRAEMRENRRIAEEVNESEEVKKAKIDSQTLAFEPGGSSIDPQCGPNILRKIETPKSGTKWHKGDKPKGPKVWYEAEMEDGSGYKYYWHIENHESRWDPPPEGFLSIKEQRDINGKVESRVLHKNASIAASRSIHGKGEITSAYDFEAVVAGPDQKYDPYGGWKTIESTVIKALPSKEVDYQCPQGKAPIQSSATLHSEKDRYNFKEKTISSLEKQKGSLEISKPSISFRKRKVNPESKKKFIRRREDDN